MSTLQTMCKHRPAKLTKLIITRGKRSKEKLKLRKLTKYFLSDRNAVRF